MASTARSSWRSTASSSNFGTRQGKRNVLRSLLDARGHGISRAAVPCGTRRRALQILERKEANPALMKGSWAGAMGSVQFMPTSYLRFSVDEDRDGLHDIWTNVPDSPASIANFLKAHGWQAGREWGAEVMLPSNFAFGAGLGSGEHWRRLGIKRRDGRAIPAGENFYLLFLSGAKGPAFLVSGNYGVLKEYNHSRPLCHLDRSHRQSHRPQRHGASQLAGGRQAAQQGAAAGVVEAAAGAGLPDSGKEARIDLEERETIRKAQKSLGLVMDGNPTEELLRRLRLASGDR